MQKKELLIVYTLISRLWPNYEIPTQEPQATINDQVFLSYLTPFKIDLITDVMLNYAKKSNFLNIGEVAGICEEKIKFMWYQKLCDFLPEEEIKFLDEHLNYFKANKQISYFEKDDNVFRNLGFTKYDALNFANKKLLENQNEQ